MSARDAINIIDTLPLAEVRIVLDHIKKIQAENNDERRMDRTKAREISRRIMAENHELFRKLAQ